MARKINLPEKFIEAVNASLSMNKHFSFELSKAKSVRGLLTALREQFPNNYIDKYTRSNRSGNTWVYTIYAGDKATMEFWHSPLPINAEERRIKKEYNRVTEALRKEHESKKQ